ncbi:MAG: hypothetical protein NXI27_19595 [Alphaproteobacteria bacterium]|nr:hypothetical protein [Alphaproteobacteria bacterium]
MASSDIVHTAGVYLETPLEFAFDHLCDPQLLGRWALGCMDLKPAGTEGVFVGRSLFDDAAVHVAIHPNRALGLIDYLVGDQDKRQPRISIRLVPGALCDLPDEQCAAAMTAWRVSGMTQARWDQLTKTHEVEVLLFKAQIETRFQRLHG